MHIRVISMIFLLMVSYRGMADHPPDFKTVDSVSYALYEKGEWKALVRFGKEAINQGFDYYYLRMRMGIAYYEMEKYLLALDHFRRSLKFSTLDPVVKEYIYYCYHLSGDHLQAAHALKMIPVRQARKIEEAGDIRYGSFFNLETGPVIYNYDGDPKETDLDGPENQFGEADLARFAYYFNIGARVGFGTADMYLGYTSLNVQRDHILKSQDNVVLDERLNPKQRQFYVNTNIYLGKGFVLTPAIDFVTLNYRYTDVEYDPEGMMSNRIIMKPTVVQQKNIITFLSLVKRFDLVHVGLSGAYSNLNYDDQWQAGVDVAIFPLGNLNLYSLSKLLSHVNNGKQQLIFDQVFGARLFGQVWSELGATIGEMENYHEKNAFLVYNTEEKINFKTNIKLIWNISQEVQLSLEYRLFMRESSYKTINITGGIQDADPSDVPVTFHNHIFTGGLIWKF